MQFLADNFWGPVLFRKENEEGMNLQDGDMGRNRNNGRRVIVWGMYFMREEYLFPIK